MSLQEPEKCSDILTLRSKTLTYLGAVFVSSKSHDGRFVDCFIGAVRVWTRSSKRNPNPTDPPRRTIWSASRLCTSLADFPERSLPRDDLLPGLRTVSLERPVLIALTVTGTDVTILRVLYAGRVLSARDVPV